MLTKSAEILNLLNQKIQHKNSPLNVQAAKNIPATPSEQKSGEKMQILEKPNVRGNKKQLKSSIDLKDALQIAQSAQLQKNPILEVIKQKNKPQAGNKFKAELEYKIEDQTVQSLTEILVRQMGSVVSESISELIESTIKQREKNAYDCYTRKDNQYLQVLLENTRRRDQYSLNMIDGIMSKRYAKVSEQLEEGTLLVQRERNLSNRHQLSLLEDLDRARRIKIKDGELRSKLDILQDKMKDFEQVESYNGPSKVNPIEEEMHKKIIENMEVGNYSLDSEKTKIAKDYVKYMQHQKKIFQKRQEERRQQALKHDAQRQADLKEAAEMRDLAKRQEMLQKIEQMRRKRQEEQKQQMQKEEHVQKFLDEYRKKMPLYKKKEKQFQEKYVQPQIKFRQQKLSQIKSNRRSMSMEEMKAHQQKYLSKLVTEKAKRQEQFKMIVQSRQANDNIKPHYKGITHKRVLEMTKEEKLKSYSLSEANKHKMDRMKEYGQVIHKQYKPSIDADKKQQLLKFIELEQMKKKGMRKAYRQVFQEGSNQPRIEQYYEQIPKKNLYVQGNKFLEISKKNIKKRRVELISQPLSVQDEKKEEKPDGQNLNLLRGSPVSEGNQKKQKNIWEIRAKQLSQIAGENVQDAKKFEWIKQNFSNMDQKAAEKQKVLRQLDMCMSQHMQQKGMLDNFYLQSIRNKMKLLQ